MKLSVKTRYGLAALLRLAESHEGGERLTAARIAGDLGLSKLYLEQSFSLLKRSGLIEAEKGAQGGYRLALAPGVIDLRTVLAALEPGLFAPTEKTVPETAPSYERAWEAVLYQPLQDAADRFLASATLADAAESARRFGAEGYMYYL